MAAARERISPAARPSCKGDLARKKTTFGRFQPHGRNTCPQMCSEPVLGSAPARETKLPRPRFHLRPTPHTHYAKEGIYIWGNLAFTPPGCAFWGIWNAVFVLRMHPNSHRQGGGERRPCRAAQTARRRGSERGVSTPARLSNSAVAAAGRGRSLDGTATSRGACKVDPLR